jgi:monoamine oxidase
MIANLGYGTNAKLMLGFDSRPWRKTHGKSGSTLTDNGPQTIWETSRGQAGAEGILTVFTGGAEGLIVGGSSAEARALAYLRKLEVIYPGVQAAYRPGSAVRMHWPTFEFMKGSYACFKPGQAIWSGTEGERVGNLHFAGEHTSVDFQGYMEGAAESGIRAAEEIVADLMG